MNRIEIKNLDAENINIWRKLSRILKSVPRIDEKFLIDISTIIQRHRKSSPYDDYRHNREHRRKYRFPSEKSALDNYIFKNTLGSGTYGLVILAYDKISQKNVAIKIQIGDVDKQELDILNKIKKGCNTSFLCVDVIYKLEYLQPITFIVAEYVEMKSMDEIISMPMSAKIRIVEELYTSIKKLHSLGIAHKDIKPDNIGVTDTSVKLLDYGLSCITKKCRWGGSPRYMHPYLFNTMRALDIKLWQSGDFYSLYVICKELEIHSDNPNKYNKLKMRFLDLDLLKEKSRYDPMDTN